MCPNTDFFSGPYFSVFELNTGKYGPEKNPYLDTFLIANILSVGWITCASNLDTRSYEK